MTIWLVVAISPRTCSPAFYIIWTTGCWTRFFPACPVCVALERSNAAGWVMTLCGASRSTNPTFWTWTFYVSKFRMREEWHKYNSVYFICFRQALSLIFCFQVATVLSWLRQTFAHSSWMRRHWNVSVAAVRDWWSSLFQSPATTPVSRQFCVAFPRSDHWTWTLRTWLGGFSRRSRPACGGSSCAVLGSCVPTNWSVRRAVRRSRSWIYLVWTVQYATNCSNCSRSVRGSRFSGRISP